jgi:uncharacterized protein YcbK (DUF882 family)
VSLAFITPNFSWQEFACHDGTEVPDAVRPNVRRLCTSVLEPLRTRWGGPIVVISGYRTRSYNASVGGARLSRHCDGEAADIRPVSLARVVDLRTLVEDMIRDGDLPELGGVGTYKGWVHVDVRARPPGNPRHIAYWSGTGIGAEQA